MPELKIGSHVREVICGIEGIITSRAIQMNGNIRICIQQPRKDDKVPDPEWVDQVRVEWLDDGVVDRAVQLPSSSIPLGGTVYDLASNFKGVVIDRVEDINGCVRHGVIAEPEKPGKSPVLEYFDHARPGGCYGSDASQLAAVRHWWLAHTWSPLIDLSRTKHIHTL